MVAMVRPRACPSMSWRASSTSRISGTRAADQALVIAPRSAPWASGAWAEGVAGAEPRGEVGSLGWPRAVDRRGRSYEVGGVDPRHFDDRALRGERAAQHRDAALLVDRSRERADDLAVGVGGVQR